MGTVTTGVSFDTELLNDIKEVSSEMGISVSRYVQIACRNQIKVHKKQAITQIWETLSVDEKNILKNYIKKGA